MRSRLLEEFRVVKDDLLKFYKQSGEDSISFYCAVSGVPIVVAYLLLYEEYKDPKYLEKIKRVNEFYGEKDVY